MQHDDLIWRNINQTFCSFKTKTATQTFCRNKYNLTGLCSRMSCPLANSRYATIIEHDGKLMLYLKTVERAHSPRALWEKMKLSENYKKALAQIDKHLEYWPEFYIHKAKQRLTKMTQYLIRKRRLELRTKTRLVGVTKKVDRREAKREKKAVVAAKLESAIEKELLQRLKLGHYNDIYNFPQEQYEKALDGEAQEEDEMELDDDFSGDEYEAQYDDEDESEEEVNDLEDIKGTAVENGAGDFDFDDFSDDKGEEVQQQQSTNEPSDALSKLRARAKKRAQAKKTSRGGKGKKGKRLEREVELEYEREDQRTAQLSEQ